MLAKAFILKPFKDEEFSMQPFYFVLYQWWKFYTSISKFYFVKSNIYSHISDYVKEESFWIEYFQGFSFALYNAIYESNF